MARYYRRRSRGKSSPSMWATATGWARAIPKALGVKSPIGQTVIAFPIILGVLARFMPTIYEQFMDLPNRVTDFIDDKMGGM